MKFNNTMAAVSVIGLGVSSIVMLVVRSMAKDHVKGKIRNNRSEKETRTVNTVIDLTNKVKEIEIKEATTSKDFSPVIERSNLATSLRNISTKTDERLKDLVSNTDSTYFDFNTVEDAFSDIPDATEALKKLKLKAREDAIKASRPAEDWQVFYDLASAKGDLYEIQQRETKELQSRDVLKEYIADGFMSKGAFLVLGTLPAIFAEGIIVYYVMAIIKTYRSL